MEGGRSTSKGKKARKKHSRGARQNFVRLIEGHVDDADDDIDEVLLNKRRAVIGHCLGLLCVYEVEKGKKREDGV